MRSTFCTLRLALCFSFILSCKTRTLDSRLNVGPETGVQESAEKKCALVAKYFSGIEKKQFAQDLQTAANEFMEELKLPENQPGSQRKQLQELEELGNNIGMSFLLSDPSAQTYLPPEISQILLGSEPKHSKGGADSSYEDALARFWAVTLTQSFFFNEGAAAASNPGIGEDDLANTPSIQANIDMLSNSSMFCDSEPIRLSTLSTGGSRHYGGMFIYKGVIFADQWYALRKDDVSARFVDKIGLVTSSNDPLKQFSSAKLLLTKQPYIEFEPAVSTVASGTTRPSPWRIKLGASKKLIDILFEEESHTDLELAPHDTPNANRPRISVFRGTSTNYDEIAEAQNGAQRLAESQSPSSRMSDFGPYLSEFGSPNYYTGLSWAAGTGTVVHFAAAREAFADIGVVANNLKDEQGKNHSVGIPLYYAGIEHGTVEMAFLYDAKIFKHRVFREFQTNGQPLPLTTDPLPTEATTIVTQSQDRPLKFGVTYIPITQESLIFRAPFCHVGEAAQLSSETSYAQTFYQDSATDRGGSLCYSAEDLSGQSKRIVPDKVRRLIGSQRPASATTQSPQTQPAHEGKVKADNPDAK